MTEPYKLIREVKEDKPELDKVFYGDNVLMASLPKFEQVLKKDEEEHHLKITKHEENALYYNNQAVRQVFKPHENEHNYIHILAYYPFERVFMDSMYLRLGNSTMAFVNIIDLFSKYAFSRVFFIKKNSQALPSSTTTQVFNEFLDTITHDYPNLPIGIVTTDLGSEYLGNFQHNLREKDIPQVFANAGDKRKTSPIERFNKTLRLYIEKYRVVYGKIDRKVLQLIVDAYNNVNHADLKHTPIEILKDPKFQEEADLHYSEMNYLNDLETIPVGSHVRKLLDISPFQKIKPIWSSEIYTVKSYLNSVYKLDDDPGNYNADELQVVNPEFVMNDKKVDIKPDIPDEPEVPNTTPPVEIHIRPTREAKKNSIYYRP